MGSCTSKQKASRRCLSVGRRSLRMIFIEQSAVSHQHSACSHSWLKACDTAGTVRKVKAVTFGSGSWKKTESLAAATLASRSRIAGPKLSHYLKFRSCATRTQSRKHAGQHGNPHPATTPWPGNHSLPALLSVLPS